MTEEDSNDDGFFVTHKFEWRSNSKHWSLVILPCFMPYFFFLYSLSITDFNVKQGFLVKSAQPLHQQMHLFGHYRRITEVDFFPHPYDLVLSF